MKNSLLFKLETVAFVFLATWGVAAQQPSSVAVAPRNGAVPRLVSYSGILKDANGRPVTDVTGVTFLLYKNESGGAPLWLETQNVKPDASGHYSVQLGAASSRGLSAEIFMTGDGRWLGVQIGSEPEQPRALLVAVPYAMKAADAETVGGLPPSAFILAGPSPLGGRVAASSGTAAAPWPSAPPPPASNVTTTGGTTNAIPVFTTGTNIQNSILTQTATSAINVGGKLVLPATGPATASKGFISQPLTFVGSVFNSGISKAINQKFQWQAEPVGNNTSTPSGTLNLLYATGTAVPVETGLKVNNKGQITFAAGQTFPGTGKGTVTSVALSAPSSDFTVSGSPVTSAGTLNLAWKIAPTNASTPNAIVKRDASGSFNVKNINGSGSFTTTTSNATAIQGSSSSDGGRGVHGSALAASGTHTSIGVLGDSISTRAFSAGVFGLDGNSGGGGGVTVGVQGESRNPGGIGMLGFNGLSRFFGQVSGAQRIGVWGDAEGALGEPEGIGVVGTSGTGVGVLAENGTGSVFPALIALGGSAPNGTADSGVAGIATTGGNGGCCLSTGEPGQAGAGIIATGGFGNLGNFDAGGPGVGGVFTGGSSDCAGNGCEGDGILATPGTASTGQSVDGLAGNFIGDVLVDGTLLGGAQAFKIDHPLDPANKYLVHASVESSEMKNIYDGVVISDAQGEAAVQLPEWFEVLNTDFRYQLTVIGQFAQAIVAREIQHHEFTIRTSAPNVKVSWQVTGIRQDAFAKAHPLVVEERKDARLRGFYLHPELYGAPEEKQIEWARHPQLMRQIKEQRIRQAGLSRHGTTAGARRLKDSSPQ